MELIMEGNNADLLEVRLCRIVSILIYEDIALLSRIQMVSIFEPSLTGLLRGNPPNTTAMIQCEWAFWLFVNIWFVRSYDELVIYCRWIALVLRHHHMINIQGEICMTLNTLVKWHWCIRLYRAYRIWFVRQNKFTRLSFTSFLCHIIRIFFYSVDCYHTNNNKMLLTTVWHSSIFYCICIFTKEDVLFSLMFFA